MRNSRFFESVSSERKNPFLPGSWQREIYSPCTLDFPRDICREKEENAK